MRFYCLDCGRYMNYEDLQTRRECMGEFWGSPAYEEFMMCPHCQSDDIISEDDRDFPKEDEDMDEIEEEARELATEVLATPHHYSRNPLDDLEDEEDPDDYDD